MFLGESDGVFGHHCFACRCVSGHKHGVVSLQPEHSLLLEDIQLERPLEQRRKWVVYYQVMIHTVAANKQVTLWGLHRCKRTNRYMVFKARVFLESPPWKLGLGRVYRNHRRVPWCWRGWPISYFPPGSLLTSISHLFLSLGELRMTQHPGDREGEPDFSEVNVQPEAHLEFRLLYNSITAVWKRKDCIYVVIDSSLQSKPFWSDWKLSEEITMNHWHTYRIHIYICESHHENIQQQTSSVHILINLIILKETYSAFSLFSHSFSVSCRFLSM